MYEHVFSPIRIGNVEVRNRIVRSANATNLTKERIDETLIEYTRIRAEAGVGLFINGNACVQKHISTSPFKVYDDVCIDEFRRLMDVVGPNGARMFQQLWHPGHNVPPPDGSPPVSASDVPGPRSGIVPLPLTRAQIAEIVGSFAAAARRCELGGLDGVEIHGAHGYLFQQFLSPLTNRRTDEYGGNPENRMRFTIEVLTAIRESVGADFAVGMKMSPQAFPGGLTATDLVPLVQALADRGIADFVDLSFGSYFAMDKILGPMHEPPGYQLEANRRVLEMSPITRIVNGRFGTLAEAEEVIASGQADMVAMTRALIADGTLVEKFRSGQGERVRPCIACNEGCIGGLGVDFMSCSVNPAVQTPYEGSIPAAAQRRRVLVVGGGPAGMEAARVSAVRGHEVMLVEAEDQLGGAIRTALKAPRPQLLGKFIEWQERELRALGVDVRLRTRMDHSSLEEVDTDVLILATGSSPRADGIQYRRPRDHMPGIGMGHVYSSREIFDADLSPHKQAVIIDDTGHFEAADVAEYLLSRGLIVHFLTSFEQFAPLLVPLMSATPTLSRLVCTGRFFLHTEIIIDQISETEVRAHFLDTSGELSFAADLVVWISPNRSERSLLDAAQGLPNSVHVVGDANSPRFLGAAVREGFRAGLST